MNDIILRNERNDTEQRLSTQSIQLGKPLFHRHVDTINRRRKNGKCQTGPSLPT